MYKDPLAAGNTVSSLDTKFLFQWSVLLLKLHDWHSYATSKDVVKWLQCKTDWLM